MPHVVGRSRGRRAQQYPLLSIQAHGHYQGEEAYAQGDGAAQDDHRPIERQAARRVGDEVELADGRDEIHP